MKLKVLFLIVMSVSSAWSIEDTPEARLQQAQRYMKVTPPEALFADMAEQGARNLPPDQREAFKATLTKNLDVAAITKAIQDAIVKNFTADEIKALADFYGSEVGKSAMKKFGTYMADAMPAIQAEMMKAMAKTNQQLPAQEK